MLCCARVLPVNRNMPVTWCYSICNRHKIYGGQDTCDKGLGRRDLEGRGWCLQEGEKKRGGDKGSEEGVCVGVCTLTASETVHPCWKSGELDRASSLCAALPLPYSETASSSRQRWFPLGSTSPAAPLVKIPAASHGRAHKYAARSNQGWSRVQRAIPFVPSQTAAPTGMAWYPHLTHPAPAYPLSFSKPGLAAGNTASLAARRTGSASRALLQTQFISGEHRA